MNIEECYEKVGGNYAEVIQRLPSQKLIEKFIGKFLEDKSYETLCLHMENGNREEAFRAAHTLKGVCANLGFSALFDSASRLTEELRAPTDAVSDEAAARFEDVRRSYAFTTDTLRSYLQQV